MEKRFLATIAVLLVISIVLGAVSFLLVESNSKLQQDNTAASTRLEMNSIIQKGQMLVQGELKRMKNLTFDLAVRLGGIGLNGTQARQEINLTLALNPYAIDILTFDTNGIVQAIEPERYAYMEGVDLSGGNKTREMLTYKVPTLSNTFIARGIERGSGMACPVFNPDGKFIGAVSTLINVSALMDAVLPDLIEGMDLYWFCIQLDATEIYDTDASQIGLNLLTSPEYANYPEVPILAEKLIDRSTGYTTYSFIKELDTNKLVTKECFWTTVGAEGIQWRLGLSHVL